MALTPDQERKLDKALELSEKVHSAVVGDEELGHEGLVKKVRKLEGSEKKRMQRNSLLMIILAGVSEGFKGIISYFNSP